MSLLVPSGLEIYVTQDGRLTPAGLKLFQSLLAELRSQEKRITALETP